MVRPRTYFVPLCACKFMDQGKAKFFQRQKFGPEGLLELRDHMLAIYSLLVGCRNIALPR